MKGARSAKRKTEGPGHAGQQAQIPRIQNEGVTWTLRPCLQVYK